MSNLTDMVFICSDGPNNQRLYLSPHGPGKYKVIDQMLGAAGFYRSKAEQLLKELGSDFYLVPIDLSKGSINKVDYPTWVEMNSPKS